MFHRPGLGRYPQAKRTSHTAKYITSFSQAGAVGTPWQSAYPARVRFGQLAVFSVSFSDLSLVRILSATCPATSVRSTSGTSV